MTIADYCVAIKSICLMKNRLLKYALGTTLLVFCMTTARSQSLQFGNDKFQIDVGLNFGPTFFLGDLGGNRGTGKRFIKDVNLGLTKLMKGAFITVYPNDWLGIRAAAQFGKIEGEDKVIEKNGGAELFRKQRNLDFRSNLFEAYVAAEIYPLQLLYNRYGDYNPRLQPYGVAGVGVYHYDPQGSLTDANGNKTWYYLRPLHLEGQGFAEYPDRKEYELTQINIPLGLGAKYWITEKINVSLEVLLRKTFNDYVDDVSTTYIDPTLYDKYLSPADAQIARKISDKMDRIVGNPNVTRFAPGEKRGNPNQNDSWVTTFLKFGWKITGNPSRHELMKMRCPTRF